MMENNTMADKKLILSTVGTVSALSLSAAAVAGQAPGELFQANSLDAGFMLDQPNFGEGSCGEGSCGEGSCGEGEEDKDKDQDKDAEGSCGEGACGEGSCGEGDEDKDAEGSCGEGSCGEGSCGAA
jgi:uncharacterized low-complexity protein